MQAFRRIIARSVVCAALGAATTVGVAWGLATWGAAPRTVVGPAVSKRTHAMLMVTGATGVGREVRRVVFLPYPSAPDPPGSAPVSVIQVLVEIEKAKRTDLAFEEPWPRWGDLDRSARSGESVEQYAAGWPVVCVWCERPVGAPSGAAPPLVAGAMVVGSRVVPYRPIWAGAMVNVGAYGAGFFVLATGLRWLRRARRRWGGRCVECAYELAGVSGQVCPECGAGRVGRG